MGSFQEIIFSLMILVGLSMILYDVINARTVARTAKRKNLPKKSWGRSILTPNWRRSSVI